MPTVISTLCKSDVSATYDTLAFKSQLYFEIHECRTVCGTYDTRTFQTNTLAFASDSHEIALTTALFFFFLKFSRQEDYNVVSGTYDTLVKRNMNYKTVISGTYDGLFKLKIITDITRL